MTNRTWRPWQILGLLCTTMAGMACSEPSHLPVPDGAATGTGGGTAGAGAGGGVGGIGGQTASCQPAGPRVTSDEPRRTIPWILTAAAGGAAGGASGSGAGGAGSGCAVDSSESAVCNGPAQVAAEGAALRLIFADGSTLRWDTSQVPTAVAPPALQDGATAWVDYANKYGLVCPFCGSWRDAHMVIRPAAGADPIWVAREGNRQGDIDDALSMQLFGVPFSTQAACTFSYPADCFRVTRTTFDHVLATSPPQTLRHGELARVTTPKGTYDVVWAASTETSTIDQNCADGGTPSADTAFAASLISAAP